MTEKNIHFFKPAGQEGDYVERDTIAIWLRAYRRNKHITIVSANSDKTKGYVITIGNEFDLFATIIIH
jgi:hypothetical protein